MDIFYGLEKYKKHLTSYQKESLVQEETSKWERVKDSTKNVFGCFGTVFPAIALFSAPWWLQELLGESAFNNSIVIVFTIVAVLFFIALFYGVWKLVNKYISKSKTKVEIIITSIIIYVLIVALLVGVIYVCATIAPTVGVNDGHLHRL